ncbi:hypothetical protein J3R30DRAFT_3285414 [Lentinula aciculospora]|uniref:Alpha/beta hydrolase fold-3 domain-containing protein n=1 Tax=Lentinula aciculospora TaxID=153920 RepID=A0A9W9AJX0_9AGAR|nr:hypothetical protein J3R30DRAFT_3285414 [Lentinula aciculospora]
MAVSSLTRSVGLRVGPIVLGTLVKHYLEKIKRDLVQESKDKGKEKDALVQLRQDELIYDEIFTVVKSILLGYCSLLHELFSHSVEDIQSFSNTRTPSPPWVHVVRVRVPMSSCDEAAKYLITAFGGQQIAVKLVGGVKWWQVRSLDGVDAQWITAKKDWQEAKRRHKDKEKTQRDEKHEPIIDQSENATYNQDMDTMRCILYAHGGGYYFGSVDQERYSIQRYARKINGRVFAINYRLAPQYPFPCAIQDLLAAYLYLIRPPPGASHMPVKPSHMVVAGDSAGGGLTLSLLQVLRDASLPLPAGGILISPWCDLTHSFPSIHTNTATDVIPPYGLSLHKPSTLWPPPDEELAGRVRTGLRQRVRAVFKGEADPNSSVLTLGLSALEPHPNTSDTNANSYLLNTGDASNGMPINVGATTPLPLPNSSASSANPFDSNSAHESIIFKAQNGEVLSIQQQIQLYTTNALLGHPLVSPALGYLGGLPPLMMIIGDREVLRDEGIYTAHKAAHPEQFSIRDTTRALYPVLYGIEERFKGKPTPVHLQVYDDSAHVLPVLFSFTTPAKYCFRSMAIFCKYVTGMPLFPNDGADTPQKLTKESSSAGVLSSFSSSISSALSGSAPETDAGAATSPPTSPQSIRSFTVSGSGIFSKSGLSIRRKSRKSTGTSGPNSELNKSGSEHQGEFSQEEPKSRTVFALRSRKSGLDIGKFKDAQKTEKSSCSSADGRVTEKGQNSGRTNITTEKKKAGVPPPAAASVERCAGDPIVYSETAEFPSLYTSLMIRERVSTRGVIRPLEPPSDLSALSIPPQLIGEISERAVRRYIEGRTLFDHKFSGTRKVIEQRRKKHLMKARSDTTKNISALKGSVERERRKMRQDERSEEEDHDFDSSYLTNSNKGSTPFNIETALLASSGWSWSWALDHNEHPPPSSLVARRDTHEALILARIADQAVLQDEQGGVLSGNNLWGIIVGFLTPTGNGNGSAIRAESENSKREGDKRGQGAASSSKRRKEDMVETPGQMDNGGPSLITARTLSRTSSSPPLKNGFRARLVSVGGKFPALSSSSDKPGQNPDRLVVQS